MFDRAHGKGRDCGQRTGGGIDSGRPEQTPYRVDTTVSIDRSSWIAARVVGPPHRLVVTDEQVLAHTSPVYSYLGEQEISSPEDALYFVNWIDDLIRKVEQHGVFSKLDHKYEIIQLFRKAQDVYARKAQSGN